MAIKWADDPPPSKIRWEDPPAQTPVMPQATAVLGGTQIGESRDDKLRREAHEDIVAGMGVGERLALGFDRGVTRIGQSLKQIALEGLGSGMIGAPGAMIPIPESVRTKTATARDAYNKELQGETAAWNLGAGKDAAANVGDIAGSLAVTLPIGGPAGKGGSILANAGKNALIGGTVSGLTTPVDDGGEDFLTSKAKQTAIGGAVSGGASALLQGAGKLIEEIPGGNLLRRGYNALANRANAKPAAAEGEALAKQFGVELTPGQVSGGKGQLAVENMARQSIFTRDKVFETDMKIADQYADAINKTLDKISTKGGDAASAGKSIRASVDKSVEQLSKRRARLANEDFKLVDELAKGAPIIKPDSYKAKLAELLEDYSAAQDGDEFALASSLKKMIDNAGMMESAAGSIAQRRHLSRVAGGQTSLTGTAGQPIQKRAAAQLLSAIDQDIEAASGAGGSIGDALKKANDRYRAYSQKIDGIKKGPVGKILGKDLVDVDGQGFGSVSAEQIFDKFSKLPPDHIHVALKSLSPEATAQVKRAYVQKALEAAQQPTATGGATQASIRPTTFVASLQRNPEDKRRIAALFTPDERKELDALMSVGRRIGDRTGANTSETAVMSQTMGILEKLRSGTLRGLAEVGGAALGTREIARIMADSGGRKALMELRRLPPNSAKARDLAAYIGGLAAAKEYDE
jgi:hypothetical protein